MKTIALSLALALAGSAYAAEGPKKPSKPELRANVANFSLNTVVFYCPSGLTVMFQEDRTHPIVSIMSIVDHGSGDDPKGKEGTAHLVEHTWFRSTQTVEMGWDENGNPVKETLPSIMDTLGDYGTLMNATTRHDWTDYRTVFASRDLDLFLQLESRRLTSPYVGVTEDQIAVEKEVITNEWRRRNDQNASLLFDYVYASVYPPSHPYHARESKDSLAAIDLKTLQNYFDAHYKPEKTTIAIVGDFDLREAQSLLFKNFDPKLIDPLLEEKHIYRYPKPGVRSPDQSNPDHWLFGAYDPVADDPTKPIDERVNYARFLRPADDTGPNDQAAIDARIRIRPDSPREEPPERYSAEMAKREAPIDDRTVLVAWSLPAGFREDQAKLNLLNWFGQIAITNYFNGQNFKIYREEWRTSDIKDPFCFIQTERLASTMICGVTVPNPKLNPESIAEKIIDQMPTIWNPDLVTLLEQRSLPYAQQQSLASILKSVDNVAYHFGGRAEDIVTHAHYTGSPTYHSEAMRQSMTINALDVATIASKYLTRKRAVKVLVDPLPPSKIDRTGEGSTYAGASEGDQTLEGGGWLSRVTDEEIAKAYVRPAQQNVIDKKLSNGVRVIVHPHGDSPVALTKLVLNGGTLTGEKNAFTFMRDFSYAEGTESIDPLSIAGESYAEYFSDHSYMAIRHASGNVDGALWMLRQEVDAIRPYVASKKTYITNWKKGLTGRWGGRSAGWLISEHTSKHIYPDAENRWPTTWEQVEKMNAWTAVDVERSLGEVYHPANATVIVTGRIEDPEKTFEQVGHYFGGWTPRSGAPATPSATTVPTPAMPKESRILVFDDPKRTQTQVTGSCRLNRSGPEDEPAVAVLSSLIGNETFTILRVKEALAYSPGGYAYTSPGNVGILGFSSLAVNDGVGRTLEVMYELVEQAEKGSYPEEKIKLHKLREARNSGLEAQSTQQMSDLLRNMVVRGMTLDTATTYGERLAAVTPEQLSKLAETCRGTMLFTLNGPVDVLKPQLDAKGYDYEVVDWKSEGETRFATYDPKGFKKYQKAKEKNAAREAEAEAGEGSASASE